MKLKEEFVVLIDLIDYDLEVGARGAYILALVHRRHGSYMNRMTDSERTIVSVKRV